MADLALDLVPTGKRTREDFIDVVHGAKLRLQCFGSKRDAIAPPLACPACPYRARAAASMGFRNSAR